MNPCPIIHLVEITPDILLEGGEHAALQVGFSLLVIHDSWFWSSIEHLVSITPIHGENRTDVCADR